MKTCKCCGQTLPDTSTFGLRLIGRQRKLLGVVQRAGAEGVPMQAIFDRLYADDADGGPETGFNVVRVMVSQLNRRLRPLGKEISAISIGGGNYGRYVLRDYARRAPVNQPQHEERVSL